MSLTRAERLMEVDAWLKARRLAYPPPPPHLQSHLHRLKCHSCKEQNQGQLWSVRLSCLHHRGTVTLNAPSRCWALGWQLASGKTAAIFSDPPLTLPQQLTARALIEQLQSITNTNGLLNVMRVHTTEQPSSWEKITKRIFLCEHYLMPYTSKPHYIKVCIS